MATKTADEYEMIAARLKAIQAERADAPPPPAPVPPVVVDSYGLLAQPNGPPAWVYGTAEA